MDNIALYLASASPRRKTLLEQLGLDFTVVPQDIDETRQSSERPDAYVMRLARGKAEAARQTVAPITSEALCLGSDTTVICAGNIFEKPVDASDARRMLSTLSGNTHQVMTAVALASAIGTEVLLSISDVTFRELSMAEIDAYWHTGEPADKAGAYGIQGLGGMFVTRINGSYSGIMGLPVAETVQLLANAGITTQQILEQHATLSS